jgi:hypothetical protein
MFSNQWRADRSLAGLQFSSITLIRKHALVGKTIARQLYAYQEPTRTKELCIHRPTPEPRVEISFFRDRTFGPRDLGFHPSALSVVRHGGWCLLPTSRIPNSGELTQRTAQLSSKHGSGWPLSGTGGLLCFRLGHHRVAVRDDISIFAGRQDRVVRRVDRAALTAILFLIGKFLLGLYLGSGAAGSAYGAASSLITLLLWVFYSARFYSLARNSPRSMPIPMAHLFNQKSMRSGWKERKLSYRENGTRARQIHVQKGQKRRMDSRYELRQTMFLGWRDHRIRRNQ